MQQDIHIDDMFPEEGEAQVVTPEAAPEVTQTDVLDAAYVIDFGRPIIERNTAYSKSYALKAPMVAGGYAIVFDRMFPLRIKAMEVMAQDPLPGAAHLLARGKTTLPQSGEEVYAAVMVAATGVSLLDYVARHGVFKEKDVAQLALKQLIELIAPYSRQHIAHGTINYDTVFFDPETNRFALNESISGFCGLDQMASYDDLDNLLSDPTAKNEYSTAADFFALGMLVLFMLTNRRPFEEIDRQETLEWRLEHGSGDAVIDRLLATDDHPLSRRMDSLLKGLLTDDATVRWQAEEVAAWLNVEEVMTPSSKIHQETTTHFMFNGREYYGTKRLAHHLYKYWTSGKRLLRMHDLSRWVSIAMKNPEMAEMIERLMPLDADKMVLSDEQLSRIIMILDPHGPIRYMDISTHIHGTGRLLVQIYRDGNQEKLQQVAGIINNGLFQFWVAQQEDPEDYSLTNLGWSVLMARQIIRKRGMGFGMERMLYEMNLGLACQSKTIYPRYVLTVPEVIAALEKKTTAEQEGKSPMDRHIASFIGQRLGLNEEMMVRPLVRYPFIAKNQHVLSLGLLSVAQRKYRIPLAPNLSQWFFDHLDTVYDQLNSRIIREDLKTELQAAAKKGSLEKLFGTIISPLFIKKDLVGYKQAQKKYYNYSRLARELRGGKKLRMMAYRRGLKASVYISYTVLALTIFYVIFTT